MYGLTFFFSLYNNEFTISIKLNVFIIRAHFSFISLILFVEGVCACVSAEMLIFCFSLRVSLLYQDVLELDTGTHDSLAH